MSLLSARPTALFWTLALLLTPATFAYEIPLESHSIREAYFLGQRNDEKMARFLDPYVKHLPLPEKGPYISEIELLTPYAQVVDLSRQRTQGYSAQQAEKDYHDRGDTIQVRVRIEFTRTYGAAEAQKPAPRSGNPTGYKLRSEDFWKDFQFTLSQNDQRAEPFDTYGEPSYYNGNNDTEMTGAMVWLQYNANDVTSDPVTLKVVTPDGQHAVATFDLSKLR